MEDNKRSGSAARGVLQTALDVIGLAAGAPSGARALGRLAPVLAAALLLPVLVLAMLPGVLFQGDGDVLLGENGVQQRLEELETGVADAYATGREAVLDEITLDFQDAGADVLEISNPDTSADLDIGLVISLYCASKGGDGSDLSGEDLEHTLLTALPYLWDYTVEESVQEYPAEPPGDGAPPVMIRETVRTYTLVPAGPEVLAEQVFCLTPDQLDIALAYRDNLAAFLGGETNE